MIAMFSCLQNHKRGRCLSLFSPAGALRLQLFFSDDPGEDVWMSGSGKIKERTVLYFIYFCSGNLHEPT